MDALTVAPAKAAEEVQINKSVAAAVRIFTVFPKCYQTQVVLPISGGEKQIGEKAWGIKALRKSHTANAAGAKSFLRPIA